MSASSTGRADRRQHEQHRLDHHRVRLQPAGRARPGCRRSSRRSAGRAPRRAAAGCRPRARARGSMHSSAGCSPRAPSPPDDEFGRRARERADDHLAAAPCRARRRARARRRRAPPARGRCARRGGSRAGVSRTWRPSRSSSATPTSRSSCASDCETADGGVADRPPDLGDRPAPGQFASRRSRRRRAFVSCSLRRPSRTGACTCDDLSRYWRTVSTNSATADAGHRSAPGWLWRGRTGRGARVALGCSGRGRRADAPSSSRLRSEQRARAAAERHAEAVHHAASVAALVRRAAPALRPLDGARSGRRVLGDLEAAIVLRRPHRRLDGPVLHARCEPFPKTVGEPPPERDPRKAAGSYSCVAVTSEIDRSAASSGGRSGISTARASTSPPAASHSARSRAPRSRQRTPR